MYMAMQYRPYTNPVLRLHHRRLLSGKHVKIKFTLDEDARLVDLVDEYGTDHWCTIAFIMQTRNPRQCRERYKNYLDPALRTDSWTAEEDALLEQKYEELGRKWNKIGKFFANRSDNALRNRWMLLDRHRRRPSADSDDSTKADEFDIFDPPRADARVCASEGGEPWVFDL
jgi:hypothetical protein